MRKYAAASAVITAVLGITGFFLRRTELVAAFDASGLPIGSPVTGALIALTVVAALASLLLARGTARLGGTYEACFGFGSAAYVGPAVVLGFVLLLAAALRLRELYSGPILSVSVLIWAGLAALTGVSWIALSRDSYRRTASGGQRFFSVVPVVFLCVWLILAYKEIAPDPVLLDYAYEILAIAACTLGFYYAAGYVFGSGKPRRTVFFSQLGAYLSIVALADAGDLADVLAGIFMACALLLNAYALSCNVGAPQSGSGGRQL